MSELDSDLPSALQEAIPPAVLHAPAAMPDPLAASAPPVAAMSAAGQASVQRYAAAYHDMSLWLSRSGQWEVIRKHLETSAVSKKHG